MFCVFLFISMLTHKLSFALVGNKMKWDTYLGLCPEVCSVSENVYATTFQDMTVGFCPNCVIFMFWPANDYTFPLVLGQSC